MGWLVTLRDGTAAWLPLLFAVMLMAMLYVLWRTLEVMPRVTAAKTISTKTRITWTDVAGLDHVTGRECRPADHELDVLRDQPSLPARLEATRILATATLQREQMLQLAAVIHLLGPLELRQAQLS